MQEVIVLQFVNFIACCIQRASMAGQLSPVISIYMKIALQKVVLPQSDFHLLVVVEPQGPVMPVRWL